MRAAKKILRMLGLSDAATKVYLAALELGEATIQDLSRKSGVKRTSIYNFIESLKQQHILLETKKGKRNVYSSADIDQVFEMGKLRLMEFQTILPELRAIQNRSPNKPRVTFHEGIEGIKELYANTLNEGKAIVGWSDYEYMKKGLGDRYFRYYPLERTKRGITFKSIARDSAAARESAKLDSERLRETKFITTGDLRTEVNIYGNKVSLMSFRAITPFAVLIEDPNIAETFRVAWNELWKRL